MEAMEQRPRRIAVVGRAGAGKTTAAVRLGDATGLPVIHLDALFWTQDWKPVGEALFDARHRGAVDRDDWIIDGSYLSSSGWPDRLRRADLVVVAEAPLPVCLWRVVRRSLRRGSPRPDRASGGGEQLSLYFLWWIATWGRRHPDLARRLAGAAEEKRVVVVRDSRDLEAILPRP